MTSTAHLLLVVVLACCACPASGAAVAHTLDTPNAHANAHAAEQATAAILAKLQAGGNSNDLEAFFLGMPKGADLHHHITGAAWAETLIDVAADMKLCVVVETGRLQNPPCGGNTTSVQTAYANNGLYTSIVEAWSLRSATTDGGSYVAIHDHFFAIFGNIGLAVASLGRILAVLLDRAAEENVAYLESMVVVDAVVTPLHALGTKLLANYNVCHSENYAKMWTVLSQNAEFQALIKQALSALDGYGGTARQQLQCDTQDKAHAGCGVAIKWVYYVFRNQGCLGVFVESAFAFAVAQASITQAPTSPQGGVVGVNMVGPEDGFNARRNYTAHMEMMKYLSTVNTKVPIALHAGELRLGMVPPEDMRFHMGQAVSIAGASRLGHGVSITYEPDWAQTMTTMVQKGVAIEINLSSNEELLEVAGAGHPLPLYMRRGVPVVLSTDDPGIMRVTLTSQYALAAQRYSPDFNYTVAKTIARNSLEYSFAPSFSLWAPAAEGAQPYATPIADCKDVKTNPASPSAACVAACAESTRATLQLQLETALSAFEAAAVTRWAYL